MHHSSVNGHLGCFHVLAIVNVATMNIAVHVCFRNVVFSGYMPSSVIGESNGRFIPSFLRNLYTGFHNGCISYIPINSAGGFPSHHILSRIYCCRFFFFFLMAILIGVRRYLTVVLLCISLLMSDVQHLCTCLLGICMSSLEKCLFRSFVHFLIGLFIFLILSCMNCLYILEINLLSVTLFETNFSHS